MCFDKDGVHGIETGLCPDTAIRALITAFVCLFASIVNAEELSRGEECAHLRSELRLTLLGDGTVGVDYALSSAMRSLRLGLPGGGAESFRLEPAEAWVDAEGAVVLPNAARSFRIVVVPDRPEQRRAAEEGRSWRDSRWVRWLRYA